MLSLISPRLGDFFGRVFRFLVHRHPIILFALVRVIQALLIRTTFDPDEYYQTLEPAHEATHRLLHLSRPEIDADLHSNDFPPSYPLTWEWTRDRPIRSWVGVLPFVAYFCLTHFLGLESLLRGYEHVFQALAFQIWIDICVVWLAEYFLSCIVEKTGKGSGGKDEEKGGALESQRRRQRRFVLVFIVCSCWWFGYCGLRTYSNCVEAFLCILSFRCWIEGRRQSERNGRKEGSPLLWLCIAAIACLVRPTCFVFFVPLGATELLLVRRELGSRVRFVGSCILVGFFAILVGELIDLWCYGKGHFPWVLWNFAEFNLLSGLSSMYGVHPWHWYLTQGLPFMLGPIFGCVCCIGFAREFVSLFSLRNSGVVRLAIVMIVVFVVAFFSFLPHKEFRFLYLIFPIVVALGARETVRHFESGRKERRWCFWFLLFCSVLVQLFLFFYFGMVHQRGGVDVMGRIVQRAHESEGQDGEFRVLLLIPCHHTPGYVYTHPISSADPPIVLRSLDCSPDEKIRVGKTEEDYFFDDPAGFAETVLDENSYEWIVVYEDCCDDSWSGLVDVFSKKGFRKHAEVFHGFGVRVIDDRASDNFLIFENLINCGR